MLRSIKIDDYSEYIAFYTDKNTIYFWKGVSEPLQEARKIEDKALQTLKNAICQK